MSTGTPPTPGSTASMTHGSNQSSSSEDDLRRQLRAAMHSLNRREPLDPTYKRLLMNSSLTKRPPTIPKDKFYKKVGSYLRQRVESYIQETQGKDPWDRINQRQTLEEPAMRAAFHLREAKDYEQVPLLEATLAHQAMDPERKRALDGIALGLQSRKEKKMRSTSPTPRGAAANLMAQTESARQQAELERQREQARKWEEARKRREQEERRRREDEIRTSKKPETQQQALHKIIEPVFKKLWDMEFSNLGGTNPFRIVIDRENCAAIGAPDYFDIISIPMNLTYIQDKVRKMQYSTLQSFFSDVDLMLQNAVTYNSDPGNPYRIAAEEMKKRHINMKKKVWQQIPQRQAQGKS